MSRVFDLTESGAPSRRTRTMVSMLEAMFPSSPDDIWTDAVMALFIAFARRLLMADDPRAAFAVAKELLDFGIENIDELIAKR